MNRCVVWLLAGLMLLVISTNLAQARPQYKKAFDQKYSMGAPENVQAAIKMAACNVCHVPDKPKTARNTYGESIRDGLSKSGWNPPKIKEALAPNGQGPAAILKDLEKVFPEAEKVKDADGKPYGEQIKAGTK